MEIDSTTKGAGEKAIEAKNVPLKKIPKTEANIHGDNLSSTNDEECDPYHKDNYDDDDGDSNSDPKRDPFANVDGDPRFSQIPKLRDSNSFSATKHKQTKAAGVRDRPNPPTLPKSTLPTATASRPRRYPFKCQLCTHCFTSEETLNDHVTLFHETNKTKNGANLKPFKCQQCPSTYMYASSLATHMHSHKCERRFKCPMTNCEKAFHFNWLLQDHLSNAHAIQKSYKSREPNCGKTFKIIDDLTKHMLLHSEEKPFKCPHLKCYKEFKIEAILKQHLRVHEGFCRYKDVAKGPFKCGQCDRAFSKKWQLNIHLKTHTIEIFQCPEPNCERKFHSKKHYKQHVVIVHQEEAPLQCPEPNCEKVLKNKYNLRRHIALFHTKNASAVSFQCTQPNCDKKFKRMSYLKDHLKYHTRPHKCREPGCTRTFARPNDLQFHIESKHKNKPEKEIISYEFDEGTGHVTVLQVFK